MARWKLAGGRFDDPCVAPVGHRPRCRRRGAGGAWGHSRLQRTGDRQPTVGATRAGPPSAGHRNEKSPTFGFAPERTELHSGYPESGPPEPLRRLRRWRELQSHATATTGSVPGRGSERNLLASGCQARFVATVQRFVAWARHCRAPGQGWGGRGAAGSTTVAGERRNAMAHATVPRLRSCSLDSRERADDRALVRNQILRGREHVH